MMTNAECLFAPELSEPFVDVAGPTGEQRDEVPAAAVAENPAAAGAALRWIRPA